MRADFVTDVQTWHIGQEHTNSLSLPGMSFSLFFFILHIFAFPSVFLSLSFIIYIIRVTGERSSFESVIDTVLNVDDVLIDRLLFDNPVSLESRRKSRDETLRNVR